MTSERIKRLHITTPQGHSGELSKEARFTFNYQTTERKAEASLVLPIRAESYSSGGLFSIFQMNKPEGYLLDYLKTRFSKSLYLDDMMLLKLTGANQIGRLQYRDPNELEIPSSKRTTQHIVNTFYRTHALQFLVQEGPLYAVERKYEAGRQTRFPLAAFNLGQMLRRHAHLGRQHLERQTTLVTLAAQDGGGIKVSMGEAYLSHGTISHTNV